MHCTENYAFVINATRPLVAHAIFNHASSSSSSSSCGRGQDVTHNFAPDSLVCHGSREVLNLYSCVSRDGIRKGEFPPCWSLPKEDVRHDFSIGTECVSKELGSMLGEGNRQRLDVPTYLKQCKMSPRYILYPPMKVGVTTVHLFHLFCFYVWVY